VKDLASANFSAWMVCPKHLIQILEGKRIVVEKLFMMPVMFGHVDTLP
jgi:hypothetical protein